MTQKNQGKIPETKNYEFHITGTSPLVMFKNSNLAPFPKSAVISQLGITGKDDLQIAKSNVFRDENERVVIPKKLIYDSITRAGFNLKIWSKCKANGQEKICPISDTFIILQDNIPLISTGSTKNQKKWEIRYLIIKHKKGISLFPVPVFNFWEIKFSVLMNHYPRDIEPTEFHAQIGKLISYAGRTLGLCSFYPEIVGPTGKFKILNGTELKQAS